MTETHRRIDGRVLGTFLLLNLAVHFVPLERPGFQPDDFFFLHQARLEPEWTFVGRSLSQATRPLGFLLFILIPQLFGLHEWPQLAILISSTSLLTALVYLALAGILPRYTANLATLAFVVWPVKHEIYASQLFGVNTLAAILIVASALLYQRWARGSSPPALFLAVLCYGLSIFTYEIGYLAPIVFYLLHHRVQPRLSGLAWFLIPASLYWVFRLTHGGPRIGGGLYPLSPGLLAANLVTSLPSNLFGFQVARNIGYGLWGVISGPIWFQVWCAVTVLAVGRLSASWIREGRRASETGTPWRTLGLSGIAGALILTLPAAMVLVESRHSVLAAIGMGVAVGVLAIRMRSPLGAGALLVLLLATQGLALRQAEVSRLQASVRQHVLEYRDEIRSASSVVVDMASLANRVTYTWGRRDTNVLRGYWGLHAFSDWGFKSMLEDVIYEGKPPRLPEVKACARGLALTEQSVTCEYGFGKPGPFTYPRAGTLIVDFSAVPLP